LVSELRLTAGCVLMDLASPAVSGTSVYANGLISNVKFVFCSSKDHNFPGFEERIIESNRLDTVQRKATSHFHLRVLGFFVCVIFE